MKRLFNLFRVLLANGLDLAQLLITLPVKICVILIHMYLLWIQFGQLNCTGFKRGALVNPTRAISSEGEYCLLLAPSLLYSDKIFG